MNMGESHKYSLLQYILVVSHSLSLKSCISISGCLGLRMTTMEASSGLALTSALKNSEFSGSKSSVIFTVNSCRVLPVGKVI